MSIYFMSKTTSMIVLSFLKGPYMKQMLLSYVPQPNTLYNQIDSSSLRRQLVLLIQLHLGSSIH